MDGACVGVASGRRTKRRGGQARPRRGIWQRRFVRGGAIVRFAKWDIARPFNAGEYQMVDTNRNMKEPIPQSTRSLYANAMSADWAGAAMWRPPAIRCATRLGRRPPPCASARKPAPPPAPPHPLPPPHLPRPIKLRYGICFPAGPLLLGVGMVRVTGNRENSQPTA